MYDTIRYTVSDPVATITLDRPDRLNAVTPQLVRELQDAVGRAERDEQVIGIIITGEGRGFCAGADMERLKGLTPEQSLSTWRDPEDKPGALDEMGPGFELGLLYLMAVRKPVVAAVNGPCAGLGFVLAMLCDLRFASDQALFTTAFANRGLIAEHGISWILPRVVGPSRALDLLWSGRKVKAEEAERIGLVDRVVPHADLVYEAARYLTTLAEHSAPLAMEVIKRQVYRHLSASPADAMRESLDLMGASLGRPDFAEGVLSYLEKRPPRFARVATS